MLVGGNFASNATPNNITINIGFFLIIIFLLIGLALLIAFICYHAKDKKIERYKKLIKNPLSEKELKLITDYRNLDDENKKVVEDTVNELTTEKPNSNTMPQ